MMYPKPKLKKKRAKNNPKPTINDKCRYTDRPYASLHEVFYGSGQRQKSIKYKMQVRLDETIHRHIHQNPGCGLDMALKKEFQQKFEDKYGHELFMQEFGRNYLD